ARLRHLEVRREHGYAKRDRIPRLEPPARGEAVEEVAHGRSAPLDGKQIELPARRLAIAHFLDEELMHNGFAMLQHPSRHGVIVADRRIHQLVDKGIGLEPEFIYTIIDRPEEQRAPQAARKRAEEISQPFG